jgi:hypothetical protein
MWRAGVVLRFEMTIYAGFCSESKHSLSPMRKILDAVLAILCGLLLLGVVIRLAPATVARVSITVINTTFRTWNALVPVIGFGINLFCELPGVSHALDWALAPPPAACLESVDADALSAIDKWNAEHPAGTLHYETYAKQRQDPQDLPKFKLATLGDCAQRPGDVERNPLCLPEISPQVACFVEQLADEIYGR